MWKLPNVYKQHFLRSTVRYPSLVVHQNYMCVNGVWYTINDDYRIRSAMKSCSCWLVMLVRFAASLSHSDCADVQLRASFENKYSEPRYTIHSTNKRYKIKIRWTREEQLRPNVILHVLSFYNYTGKCRFWKFLRCPSYARTGLLPISL